MVSSITKSAFLRYTKFFSNPTMYSFIMNYIRRIFNTIFVATFKRTKLPFFINCWVKIKSCFTFNTHNSFFSATTFIPVSMTFHSNTVVNIFFTYFGVAKTTLRTIKSTTFNSRWINKKSRLALFTDFFNHIIILSKPSLYVNR